MRKLLFITFFALFCKNLNANILEINGIWYNIIEKGNIAEVVRNHSIKTYSGTYSGDIVIPDKITYEDKEYKVITIKDAFLYSAELTSVSIPNTVTTIESCAFKGCSELATIIIPNSVTSIGSSAFSECSSMTSFTIPNSITTIESGTFSECKSLTTIEIPNTITKIESYAFSGCSALTSVTIPNSVSFIGGHAFEWCTNLTSISIPNSVITIEWYAFSNCHSLSSIIIPNNITVIDNYLFMKCKKLNNIVLGTGITYIRKKAFAECDELTDVYCRAEDAPGLSEDAFNGSYPENISIHVAKQSVEKYQAKEEWSIFKQIIAWNPNEEPTYLNAVKKVITTKENYYTITGKRLSAPQRGLNIIKKSDGTTRKVLIK